jgi:dynein heavy chain
LERGIAALIEAEMGHQFVDPPAFSLASCFSDATSVTPLIFLLAGGCDPIADVLALAAEMQMSHLFESISL